MRRRAPVIEVDDPLASRVTIGSRSGNGWEAQQSDRAVTITLE
jgi:hypothetical protein